MSKRKRISLFRNRPTSRMRGNQARPMTQKGTPNSEVYPLFATVEQEKKAFGLHALKFCVRYSCARKMLSAIAPAHIIEKISLKFLLLLISAL